MNTKTPRTLQRKGWKIFGIAVGAYVLLYAANSLMGGYWLGASWDIPSNDGRSTTERMKTVGIMWQPRFGHHVIGKYGNTDFLGYFFAPLIAVDREWIHRTRFLVDADFATWSQNIPLTDVHPKQRHYFTERR